jgi:hypothetical protein
MRQLVRFLAIIAVVATVFTLTSVRHADAGCVTGRFTGNSPGTYTIVLGHSYTWLFDGAVVNQFVAGPADVGTFFSPPLSATDTFIVIDNSIDCNAIPTMSSWGFLGLFILLAAVALSRLPCRLTVVERPSRKA